MKTVEEYCDIKIQMEALEKRAKELHAILMEAGQKKYECKYGTLTLTTRKNMEVVDKEEILHTIGTDKYLEYSTIAFSKIKELVGTVVMEDLLKEGVIIEKPETVFYTFKKVKI